MINANSNLYTKEQLAICVDKLKRMVKTYFQDDKIYSNTLFNDSFNKILSELHRLRIFLTMMEENDFDIIALNGNKTEFYTYQDLEDLKNAFKSRISKR